MLRAGVVVALLAVAAGVAVAFAVAVAAPGANAPSTGSFVATDLSANSHAWRANGGGDDTATIAAGGTVTFSYPMGPSMHNVAFDTSQPTSCTQTAGMNPGGTPPPLPTMPTGQGWAGNCRFDTPGTFTFQCVMHPDMKGTVIVEAGTTGTTTTGGTSTSPGTTTAPTAGGGASKTVLAGVTFARRQRGTVVRGSLTTPAGRSRIVVTALVSNRALSKHRPKKVKLVRIGSQTKRSTGTAKTSFAVTINATARRALRLHHILAVKVRIVVTPPAGSAVTKTVAVTLRPR